MQWTVKHTFYTAAIALFFAMILMAGKAGRNCDEVLHYNHSLDVLAFHKSQGKDTSALNTPVSHLKYYGQSYDNLATFIAQKAGIEEIYFLRHIMSLLAGWLAFFVAALFAVWVGGYRAGLFVLILGAVSPTFIGHSQNNLKDIPFALAYIGSTLLMLRIYRIRFRFRVADWLLLVFFTGLAISIRPGGLLLICYFCLLAGISLAVNYFTTRRITLKILTRISLAVTSISLLSFVLGIAGWPFALKNPLTNTLESFKVMAAFPDTFRQLFMGKVEWSDFMPWYYLPVSMVVTIPLVVFAGLFLFVVFFRQTVKKENRTAVLFLAFTIVFPVFYAVAIKANIYSSWRHFLFVYPAIIILASLGLSKLWELITLKGGKLAFSVLLLFLCWHPASFIVRNTPYSYLYYNQLTGGLKGANGRFETDYYFVSQKEACEKLERYLVEKGDTTDVTVAANFSVEWYFRKYRGIKTVYVRHRERSMKEWDYLVMTNRYIDPFQLNNNIWPPESTLFRVAADGVTLGAVVRKEERFSLEALDEFKMGNYARADSLYRRALLKDDDDEMIFYNFAASAAEGGRYSEADSLLGRALSLNPGFDLAMMFRGILAGERGDKEVAEKWYRNTIACNRKFFEAYTALAELVGERSKKEARQVLLDCLNIKADWKPAVEMMADMWREERPDIAKKYEKIAKSLNN